MNKLDFYFFGEIGPYDDYNPAYICSKEHAPEILYLIASRDKYALSVMEISSALALEPKHIHRIINNLKRINAIHEIDGRFKLTFPAILESDIAEIKRYSEEIGRLIGDKIIELKPYIHSIIEKFTCSSYCTKERILYHLVCDKIFDGTAFEYFSKRNVFSQSRKQPGDRDYIIVAYEDSPLLNNYSDILLCSSNNFWVDDFLFNSFGDSNGDRRDMYRFLRKIELGIHNATPFKELNEEYNKILHSKNVELATSCGKLILNILRGKLKFTDLSPSDKLLFSYLKELKYLYEDDDGFLKQLIPIFFEDELENLFMKLSDRILREIYPLVNDTFSKFKENVTSITPMRHDVPKQETANELWHQIFGSANEYLASKGFVEAPSTVSHEGRYFRSMVINRYP